MSENAGDRSPGLPQALIHVFTIGFVTAALAILAYVAQFYLHLHQPLSSEPAVWGQFGDYFGGVLNPVIALAALLLLATGVKIQNDTLIEARNQLALQRAELEQTRAVLAEQSEQLALQADSAQQQVFDAAFFRLIETLRRLVDSFEIAPDNRGPNAMFTWALQLRDHGDHRLRQENCSPDDGAKVFSSWYSSHRNRLEPYFAIFLMVLEFVEKSDRSDAIFYVDILRATCSPGEVFILFHYGAGEGGHARFRALAEKYGVFVSFDPTTFDLPNGRRLWYKASQIPRDYSFKLG